MHIYGIFSGNLHFDPDHALHSDVAPKNYLTVIFQGIFVDKLGSTYGFIDMDFNKEKGNIGLAYLELKRDFRLGKFPFMAHFEFNEGITQGENNSEFSIPNAYLAGAAYSPATGKFKITTYLLYKYNAFKKASNDVQASATWSYTC